MFTAQVKKFYWTEAQKHGQILKIISSMGLFGNLSDAVSGLTSSFATFVREPFRQKGVKNVLLSAAKGSFVFVKDSIRHIGKSVGGILGTL
jgi:hypothetical protein